MFLVQRPAAEDIERFLFESRDLPLSYDPIGLARNGRSGFNPVVRSSSDGRTLFFTSARRDGRQDLFMSTRPGGMGGPDCGF
jgi:hypothetical protein